jgi:hypothetical protein
LIACRDLTSRLAIVRCRAYARPYWKIRRQRILKESGDFKAKGRGPGVPNNLCGANRSDLKGIQDGAEEWRSCRESAERASNEAPPTASEPSYGVLQEKFRDSGE